MSFSNYFKTTKVGNPVDLPLVDRLTQQLKDSGTRHDVARDTALSILRERGHVHPDREELTEEGKRRDAMGAAGRAVDRATKTSGRPAHDYEYDARTNRATLKKK
jgi:hypothetical protein